MREAELIWALGLQYQLSFGLLRKVVPVPGPPCLWPTWFRVGASLWVQQIQARAAMASGAILYLFGQTGVPQLFRNLLNSDRSDYQIVHVVQLRSRGCWWTFQKINCQHSTSQSLLSLLLVRRLPLEKAPHAALIACSWHLWAVYNPGICANTSGMFDLAHGTEKPDGVFEGKKRQGGNSLLFGLKTWCRRDRELECFLKLDK